MRFITFSYVSGLCVAEENEQELPSPTLPLHQIEKEYVITQVGNLIVNSLQRIDCQSPN